MKWSAITVLASALALVACDASSPLAEQPFDRLAVNGALRAACRGFAQDDGDIKTLLDLYESDRVAGYTKREALEGSMFVCWNADWPEELVMACIECGTAVIEQIWGD